MNRQLDEREPIFCLLLRKPYSIGFGLLTAPEKGTKVVSGSSIRSPTFVLTFFSSSPSPPEDPELWYQQRNTANPRMISKELSFFTSLENERTV